MKYAETHLYSFERVLHILHQHRRRIQDQVGIAFQAAGTFQYFQMDFFVQQFQLYDDVKQVGYIVYRWMQWLYEARKRYGLVILNYVVTSNHIHLVVYGESRNRIIPKSIQLLAGRTGQEYNQKKRKGAFWEDRYHATAIETGEHLLRCIIYIDLNMVRAGVVSHPKQWLHGGYNEIQSPRRKNVLIDYETLGHLCGFNDFKDFQLTHRRWGEATLSANNGSWTHT